MMHDSIDKIVQHYFRAVTREPFTYKNKGYAPKTLVVSPLLLRGFICPPSCGACCYVVSLDYLPTEEHPKDVSTQITIVNDKKIETLRDVPSSVHQGHHCIYVKKEDGRCSNYPLRAFSCDFELIRFILSDNPNRSNRLLQRFYGRGWAMMRHDGIRGALCKMVEPSEDSKWEVVRKLLGLSQWCEHFGITHKVDEIVAWVVSEPTEHLVI